MILSGINDDVSYPYFRSFPTLLNFLHIFLTYFHLITQFSVQNVYIDDTLVASMFHFFLLLHIPGNQIEKTLDQNIEQRETITLLAAQLDYFSVQSSWDWIHNIQI